MSDIEDYSYGVNGHNPDTAAEEDFEGEQDDFHLDSELNDPDFGTQRARDEYDEDDDDDEEDLVNTARYNYPSNPVDLSAPTYFPHETEDDADDDDVDLLQTTIHNNLGLNPSTLSGSVPDVEVLDRLDHEGDNDEDVEEGDEEEQEQAEGGRDGFDGLNDD